MTDPNVGDFEVLSAGGLFSSSEALYQTLVEQVPAVVYIDSHDVRPRSLYVSPQANEMFGRSPAEFLANRDLWERCIHPADWDRVHAGWAKSIETEAPFEAEYRIVKPEGTIAWVRDSSVLLRDREGRPLFWQGVMFDIASSKHAEEALRDAETRYRTLVEQVPAVVYIEAHDPTPVCLYVSPQSEAVLGHRAADYIADPGLWGKAIHPDDRERVAAEWASAVETEETYESEFRIVKPDDHVIWVRSGCVPVRGEDGSVLFWQGLLQDVTHHKRTDEALRESESRYRALVENIPAVVYTVAPDDDRRTVYVSPHVERTLGYTQQEWLDQPDIWMELLHPDDREPTLAAHDLANETGRGWSRDYRLIASDGRAVWFRDVATLVFDPQGLPLYWQGVQLDITELKKAEEGLRRARDQLEMRVLERTSELEEANEMMGLEISERKRVESELRAAEHKYRLLAEQIPAVTYVWTVIDADPALQYTSPQVERMLGYTPDEWNAHPDFWIDRLHPDDRAEVQAASMRSEATGEPFSMEYRYLAKDGHIVWVLDEATLMERDGRGRPRTFHGVMLDITARKEAEIKASESESRFRALAEQSPAITLVRELRPDAQEPPYISPQIERVLGYTPADCARTPEFWVQWIHPEDRERVLKTMLRMEETGEPWSMEYRMVTKEGRTIWVQDHWRAVSLDGSGRPKTLQGIVLDITERKWAEQQLREAEQRYRALLEQIPAITYIEAPSAAPTETPFIFLSPQTQPILGYSPQELMLDPTHLVRMVHPEDLERVLSANERSEETGEPFDVEYRVFAKDGRVVWLHSKALLVRDETGEPRFWQGVALDITERKRTQEELRKLERRLESDTFSRIPGVL